MKTRLLAIGALLGCLAACTFALAGEHEAPDLQNIASEDTPARRTPSVASPQREPGPGPGGAILNPFSQVSTASAHTQSTGSAAPPAETRMSATVIAVIAVLGGLGGLVVLVCFLVRSPRREHRDV